MKCKFYCPVIFPECPASQGNGYSGVKSEIPDKVVTFNMSDVRTQKETEPGQVGSKLLTRADLQPAVSALKWVANTTFHSSEPRTGRRITRHITLALRNMRTGIMTQGRQ